MKRWAVLPAVVALLGCDAPPAQTQSAQAAAPAVEYDRIIGQLQSGPASVKTQCSLVRLLLEVGRYREAEDKARTFAALPDSGVVERACALPRRWIHLVRRSHGHPA